MIFDEVVSLALILQFSQKCEILKRNFKEFQRNVYRYLKIDDFAYIYNDKYVYNIYNISFAYHQCE